jgi:hypothetical protein
MIEASSPFDRPAAASAFAVIQLSPRRWAVAEQMSITRPNSELRVVTKSFSNRIDAHQVCSELGCKRNEEYSALTRAHLLDPRQLRGNTTPRSRLLASWKN